MGCNNSKQFHADNVDDSIHCMIAREQKKKRRDGVESNGSHFKPRQSHPLLVEESCSVTLEEQDDDLLVLGYERSDTDRLLYHSANHNDIVDPRDVELAAA